CLFLRRSLLESIGGFDEGYGFFHGYDRDLSFSVREAGWRCAVVNAPFVHRGGGTRTGEGAPRRAQDDLEERRQALARFAAKWQRRLPSDVRGMRERVTDWLGPHRAALWSGQALDSRRTGTRARQRSRPPWRPSSAPGATAPTCASCSRPGAPFLRLTGSSTR